MTAPSQDHGRASQRERRRFQTVRWGSFALLIGCLIIGFFHRFAPAALAGTLSHTFGISASTLGGLAALNLYVYTAMQIPSGVLLDRLGVRLCASAGAAIAAAGSLVFAFAPTVAIAYLGPPLMGLGASAVFVGIMKNNTVWFAPGSYGVMAGVTMLLANVGSVLASGPSAAVLRWLSWRDLFAAAGMVSLVLAVGVYLVARDLPEHAGFSPVVTLPRPHQHRSNRPKLGERSLRGDLNRVRTIRGLWPAFWAAIGTNATFYAFAGLWGIPLLTDGFGLPNSDAALYTTLGLLAYGIASFVIGLYSDRLGRRKPLIIAASVAAVVGWLALGVLPWSPGWSGLALYLLVGLAGCQVVVAFANVKELVPTRLAATALAVVNFGVFLGAALIETLFGSILDTLRRGTSTGPRHYPLSDYRAALWLPIAVSVLGLLMSLRCRETRSRNHDDLSRHGSTASAPAGSSAASSSAAATSNPSSSGPGSTTTS